MIKTKYDKYVFIYFLLSAIFIYFLDLFVASFRGLPNFGNKIIGFDNAFMEQLIYFSIWTNIINIIWAATSLINLKSHHVQSIACSRQFFNLVVTFNLTICLVYFSGFVMSRENIVGFYTWSQILKSILEHLINPLLMLCLYFFMKTNKITSKDYATKKAWWVLLVPAAYIAFITTRVICLTELNIETILPIFPYAKFSPYKIPIYLYCLIVIAALALFYGLAVLMNFLVNVVQDKFELKHPEWFENKQLSEQSKFNN